MLYRKLKLLIFTFTFYLMISHQVNLAFTYKLIKVTLNRVYWYQIILRIKIITIGTYFPRLIFNRSKKGKIPSLQYKNMMRTDIDISYTDLDHFEKF